MDVRSWKLEFFLNGRPLGVAFDGIHFDAVSPEQRNRNRSDRQSRRRLRCEEGTKGLEIFPAITLSECQRCLVNLGDSPFRFCPGTDYQPISDVLR